MKLRDWSLRRWALVLALILLLPLIGLRLHLKWRVHRAVAELREAGRPTRYDDLYRLQGVVPDAPNLVAGLTNAVIGLRDLSQLSQAERDRLPVIGSAKIPPAGSPWPEEMRTATREYLEARASHFAEMRAALQISNAWWWTSYDPEKWNFNVLGDTKAAASHFSLQAAYLAQSGQTDAALEATRPIFEIAERMHRDPLLISHLVRNAIQAIGIQRLEFVLDSGRPSEKGLHQMREALRRQMSQESLAHVYQGELVFFLEPHYHRSSRAYIGVDWLPPDEGTIEDFKQRVLVLAYRLSGLADRDIIYCVRANSEIAAMAENVAALARFATNSSSLLPSNRGLRFSYWSEQHLAALLGKGSMNMFTGSPLDRFIDTRAKTGAAHAALAVLAYQLQHAGQLPGSLDELVPAFLEAVPVEPRSGQPFELILTSGGFGVGRGAPIFKVKSP